jgi:4-amino-4-deoxy-L-arabinose transferase-like glycosyltransferase
MALYLRIHKIFTDHISIPKKWGWVVTVFIAFFLRIWGIPFGLPNIYHADEPTYIVIAQNIFKTRDLNPHFFNYPSLFFYLNALVYIPYYLVGKLLGMFRSPADIPAPVMLTMGTGQTSMPSTFLLGRSLTVAFGCAVVVLVFLIGRRLTNYTLAGLLAALMTAISPTNVANSRYVTPDTFLVLFILLAFWEALQVFDKGDTRHYVSAGIAIGLVASTKYNGVLIGVALVSAHFLRNGLKGFLEPKLYLAMVMSIVTFLITTPFAILDHQKFLTDFVFEANHYSTGHVGMEGNTLHWYLTYLWQTEGILGLLAILGIMRGIYTHSQKIILLSVFPIVYFIFINSFVVRNDRTILPLTPFLFLLAASILTTFLEPATWRRPPSKWPNFVAGIFFLASLMFPLIKTVQANIHLTTVDSRETARIWIEQNLPPGSRIAIQPYGPYIDPQRYPLRTFGWTIDETPEWLVANHFDYMVLSQGSYGRYYREPDRYPNEIAKYDILFGAFDLVKLFTDGGYEIRIYHIVPK